MIGSGVLLASNEIIFLSTGKRSVGFAVNSI